MRKRSDSCAVPDSQAVVRLAIPVLTGARRTRLLRAIKRIDSSPARVHFIQAFQ